MEVKRYAEGEDWADIEDLYISKDGFHLYWDGQYITWTSQTWCGKFDFWKETPPEEFPEWLMYAFEAKLWKKKYEGKSCLV